MLVLTVVGSLCVFVFTMIIFPCVRHCRGDAIISKNKLENLEFDGKIFFKNAIAKKYQNEKKYTDKIKFLKQNNECDVCSDRHSNKKL